VAASERAETAGGARYHDDHMSAIFTEGFSFSGYERDLLVMNLGNGEFLDVSGVSGVDSISDGRGSVFADFDNDGDLDIFLTTAQREAHYLFRNDVGHRNGFLRVVLEGSASGRDAFGTVVRVKSSAGVQTKLKSGGGGFLSHHDSRLLFGLGRDDHAEWLEVVWPGGATRRVERVPAGSTIRIVQGETQPTLVAERRFELVDPLPAEEAFLAGLGIREGEGFPDLELRSATGERVALHETSRTGRRRLVNLWATWCVPCATEMPELEKLYPRLRAAGIDLFGVSVDLDTVDEVPGYVRSRGVTYPIYTTDEAALETLYPRGEATVPLTVLLDESGRVVQIHSGWSEQSRRALLALARGRADS
jgi:peroxiredoxin